MATPARPLVATPARPKVAVLYSGRFYGNATPSAWVASHLKNLIRPNAASVFVAVSVDNWCHHSGNVSGDDLRDEHSAGFKAAEALLRREVRALFQGWPDTHVKLLPLDPHLKYRAEQWVPREFSRANKVMFNSQYRSKLSPNLLGRIASWVYQYGHFARAEELRRAAGDAHDVVVRARMDTVISSTLDLTDRRYRNDSLVHAAGHMAVNFDGYNLRACKPSDPPLPIGQAGQDRLRTATEVVSGDAANMAANMAANASSSFCLRPPGYTSNVCFVFPPREAWMFELWHCAPKYHDWLYVTTPRAAATLATMSAGRIEYGGAVPLMRCHGWCEEEQTQLHLWKANISLVPMRGLESLRVMRVHDYRHEIALDELHPALPDAGTRHRCFPHGARGDRQFPGTTMSPQSFVTSTR